VTQIAQSPTMEQSNSSDAITEFEVRIKIINESYKHLISKETPFPFKPGMTASVDILTDKKSNILIAPLVSVTMRNLKKPKMEEGEKKNSIRVGRRGGIRTKRRSEGENKKEEEEDEKEVIFIYDRENSIVNISEVKTGISDFNNIEIIEGAREGDEIVSGPYLTISKKLEDEDKVKLEEKKERKGRRGRRRGSDK